MRLPRVVLGLGALFSFSAVADAAAASFQGMGFAPYPNSLTTAATAVSGDGSTAVGAATYLPPPPDEVLATEAARWTSASGLQLLGYLPDGFLLDGTAHAVSADGSVVVGETPNGVNGAAGFRWTAAGGMQPLGTLPGGTGYSPASGVSADGDAVVGTAITGTSTTGFISHAYLWTAGGGMISLGDLPGGAQSGNAFAISGDGGVVVGRSNATLGVEAFRWTQADGMQSLGDLPGGSVLGQALAVSFDGSTIVGSGSSAAGTEAFLWTQAGGMIGLGDLPGGTFSSTATGVSSDGAIVVGSGRTAAGARAFLWTEDAGMRDLATVLATDFGIALGGWVLTEATGISYDGTVIVGNGRNPLGVTEGWIAIIPEPTTAVLVATGGAILAVARRRTTSERIPVG